MKIHRFTFGDASLMTGLNTVICHLHCNSGNVLGMNKLCFGDFIFSGIDHLGKDRVLMVILFVNTSGASACTSL